MPSETLGHGLDNERLERAPQEMAPGYGELLLSLRDRLREHLDERVPLVGLAKEAVEELVEDAIDAVPPGLAELRDLHSRWCRG